jgi:hypothetical protein
MLRLAVDENLNNDIVRGLLRRKPELNLVRVQDVGLSGANDPVVAYDSQAQALISLA